MATDTNSKLSATGLTSTNRRPFLKAGAVITAPSAVVAISAAALAADEDSRAKLVRLEE